jgi:hypothetical protein
VGETVARSADEIAESTVAAGARVAAREAREAAPEGLEEAMRVTASGGRQATRSGRFLEALDTAPANLRESITGKPVGRVGQARINMGERLMPGAQTSIPKALAKDVLQGSPTMPTQGAGLGFRQARWRAGQVGRRLSAPGKVRTAERVGLILNDPMRALSDPTVQDWAVRGAQWAVQEHPEAVAAVGGVAAASTALSAITTLRGLQGAFEGGDGEEATAAETEPEERKARPTPPESPTLEQSIGLQQFRLDRTHATRTSRRRPNQMAALGTVTRDTTMPTQIGPKEWYGKNGYDSGRGFQPRSLPPLEQPKQHDVLGV